MNPSLTIDDLPLEMLCEIFKQLSPKELIKKKRVCRKWNQLISAMKIKRLNVVDVSYNLFNDPAEALWYETHRPQLERDVCPPKLLIAMFNSPMLDHLEYLRVNNNPCFELANFDYNKFNGLPMLVQLDFSTIDQNLSLNLPKLQIFSVTNINDPEHKLSLKCPKLQVLRYYEPAGANALHVEEPHKIRILDTSMFGDKLRRFQNVQVLKTDSGCDPNFLESILTLKNLRSLQLNMPQASLESIQTLIRALRSLTHFKLCEVSFKFKGIDLTISWSNGDEPSFQDKYTLSAFEFNLKVENIGLGKIFRCLEKPSHFENIGPSELSRSLNSLRMV